MILVCLAVTGAPNPLHAIGLLAVLQVFRSGETSAALHADKATDGNRSVIERGFERRAVRFQAGFCLVACR